MTTEKKIIFLCDLYHDYKDNIQLLYFYRNSSDDKSYLTAAEAIQLRNFKFKEEENKFTIEIIKNHVEPTPISTENNINSESKIINMQGRELMREWREFWNI